MTVLQVIYSWHASYCFFVEAKNYLEQVFLVQGAVHWVTISTESRNGRDGGGRGVINLANTNTFAPV
ncbi:hypothetical protein H6P81_011609 [Aristolochia fimbriata]|uniref:Uncharacterized protein n=1 Tax=Aristolochia fimbriata TaxID=158543 RepID=A0AAV7ETC6_ARIFI|nr:hypothetical protein H6P81_011609 [Aristolochia fimbriata]